MNTRRVRCTALLDGFLADASNAEQSYELLNDKLNAEASATLDWLPATPQQWPNTRISIDGIHSMTWTRCSLPLCTTSMLYQGAICREAQLLVNDRTPSNYRETNSMSYRFAQCTRSRADQHTRAMWDLDAEEIVSRKCAAARLWKPCAGLLR